eukprot:1963908-Rhodomonas_salina.1
MTLLCGFWPYAGWALTVLVVLAVTPMLTQLTYEGLIDDTYGINNGIVELPGTPLPPSYLPAGIPLPPSYLPVLLDP